MLHEINLNPDVIFWIAIIQNSKMKFLFHFFCLIYLPSFFALKEQLPLQAVKFLFLIKATHLSDIIIQVSKWPSSKKRNWRYHILVVKGGKNNQKKREWKKKKNSKFLSRSAIKNKQTVFLPLHFTFYKLPIWSCTLINTHRYPCY